MEEQQPADLDIQTQEKHEQPDSTIMDCDDHIESNINELAPALRTFPRDSTQSKQSSLNSLQYSPFGSKASLYSSSQSLTQEIDYTLDTDGNNNGVMTAILLPNDESDNEMCNVTGIALRRKDDNEYRTLTTTNLLQSSIRSPSNVSLQDDLDRANSKAIYKVDDSGRSVSSLYLSEQSSRNSMESSLSGFNSTVSGVNSSMSGTSSVSGSGFNSGVSGLSSISNMSPIVIRHNLFKYDEHNLQTTEEMQEFESDCEHSVANVESQADMDMKDEEENEKEELNEKEEERKEEMKGEEQDEVKEVEKKEGNEEEEREEEEEEEQDEAVENTGPNRTISEVDEWKDYLRKMSTTTGGEDASESESESESSDDAGEKEEEREEEEVEGYFRYVTAEGHEVWILVDATRTQAEYTDEVVQDLMGGQRDTDGDERERDGSYFSPIHLSKAEAVTNVTKVQEFRNKQKYEKGLLTQQEEQAEKLLLIRQKTTSTDSEGGGMEGMSVAERKKLLWNSSGKLETKVKI